MKHEIMQRIEQIRRGEVPEGYKSGSIGIVPVGWSKTVLHEVIKDLLSGTSVNSDVTNDTGIYVLKTSSISDGKIDLSESKPVIKKDLTRVKCTILQGSILISRMNTPLLVGACGYVEQGSNIHFLPDRLWQAICSSKKVCNFRWLNYLLNSERYQVAIHALGSGTSNSMKNISKDDFLNLSIVLPALVEQQKIAAILTTQDMVIELKEKRLAEKQRQKKYLMQQLLTGKKRLPGFAGKWKAYRLHEIVKHRTRRNDIGNTNVLTISAQFGLINQADFFNKAIASDDKSNYFLLKKDDFAYNKSYSSGYPFGAIKRLTRYDVGIVSPLYICFRRKSENVSGIFLEQYFDAGLMNHEIRAFAQEGARNHGLLNIGVDDFFNSKIILPSLDEQSAIAQVLSTADREISLLRQDIEQEKQKKKALMQLLLTGIVRVCP